MKHTQTATQIDHEQFLKIIPETTWQDLSDAESQTIQGGSVDLGASVDSEATTVIKLKRFKECVQATG